VLRGLTLLGVCVAALAAGCGARGNSTGERPDVVASFYPLEWAAREIAGSGANVVDLTPTGAEPHDIELSGRDVERVRDAGLVLYVGSGFQPAVEDAVASRAGPSLDVLGDADGDPHVWLDPVRFAAIAGAIGTALGKPDEARALAARILALDREYREGLADCQRRTIVASHAAFGRLASRYGLEQLSLAGAAPESEPTPRELESIVAEVRRSGATTVFREPLTTPRLAETVARETGARVAVLNPIEGLTEGSVADGEDYVSVMRANLVALREGLGCR
jgi:zinc transport system substrate-binding protein